MTNAYFCTAYDIRRVFTFLKGKKRICNSDSVDCKA